MKSSREIQPRPLTALFGSKVDEISFMQVHPFDFYAARENPVGGTVPSSATQEGGDRTRRRMAFTAEEMRHHFAIEALGKPGAFRPQPYLYTCVRCRWIFRINDSRGSIIALDGLGRRLPEPENTKRALTFHKGPCSAFRNIEFLAPEPQSTIATLLSFFSRVVHALWISTPGRRGSRSRPKAAAS